MEDKLLINRINMIEEKFPIEDWTYNGIDLWPIYRILNTFNIIKAKNNRQERPIQAEEHIEKIPVLSNLLMDDNPIDVLMVSDSIYRVEMEEVWYNRLADPFLDTLSEKGISNCLLEFSYQNAGKYPVLNQVYSIQNQILYKEVSVEISELFVPGFHEISDELERISDNTDIIKYYQFKEMIQEVIYWKNIFTEILKNKEVKIVFIVNYYQLICYGLIAAANALGIQTIDVQHGVQRDVLYHNWKLKNKSKFNTLPNYFWVWDSNFATPLLNWTATSDGHGVVIGGNPWIEMWRNKTNYIVGMYEKKLKDLIYPSDVNILVTLQPLYGLPNWHSNIPDFLIEFIAESPENYKFHIRYHQQMLHGMRNEYDACEKQLQQFVANGKVETNIASSEPLPALLQYMNLHITGFSTCVVEAKAFNVPSVVLHKRADIYFEKEIQERWVISAYNKKQLLKAVNQQYKFKESLSKNMMSNAIFDETLNQFLSRKLNSSENNLNYSTDKDTKFSILYQDKKYNEILKEFQHTDNSYTSLFYVAMAHKYYGRKNDFLDYLKKVLDGIVNERNSLNPHILAEILINFEKLQQLNKQKSILFFTLLRNPNYLGTVLKELFNRKHYKVILFYTESLYIEHADYFYFTGRAFFNMKQFGNAKIYLEKYIKINKKEDCITYPKNYLASTHFFLGVVYKDDKLEKTKAIFHFKQCLIYSNNTNSMAHKYLSELNTN